MKHLIFVFAVMALPIWINAQQASTGQTATLKIYNIHVELNGRDVNWDETYEVAITNGIMSPVIIFEQESLKYGTQFTHKKGSNRLKLVRRGYAIKAGMKTKFGIKRKDMQEIKTSIPGSLSKRVVDNIVLSKENLEAINVSYNYELIYK
jgi:hypothetical protein